MSEISKKLVVSSDLEKNLIFQSLLRMKEPIELELGGFRYPGFVKRYDRKSILLDMQTPLKMDVGGPVRAHFIFHNSYHYFDTAAQKKDDSHIQLLLPEKINRNMLRANDRIDGLNRVFMRFKILIHSKRKELLSSSLLDERVIMQEVSKPKPAVDKILAGIKRLVSDFAQNFQVKVFKEDEKLSFDESILKQSGKIFLIYDSFEDNIEGRRHFEQEVIGISDAYALLIHAGESRKNAESKLLDLLQQKRNGKVFSESLIPLMLEGEVVGYIRLFNDMDYHRSIKPAFALRAAKYATVLVEALVKYDYFTLESGEEFDVPVINVSAGGLLFKLDRSAVKQYLILRTTLMMTIQFTTHLVEASGVIHRIDKERSEFGVKFFTINEVDSQFIDDVVHGKVKV